MSSSESLAGDVATPRLFFALWPDAATRVALTACAAHLHTGWAGRCVQSASLHLTLAFLGATPVSRLDTLRQRAARVAGETFTLQLDRPGCWPHNRVGWLGVQETPAALAQLVVDLRRALHAGEFAVDDQRFIPHVTLLRNARCGASPSCPGVVWPVQHFVLLASRAPGVGGYDVLGEWPVSRRELSG